MRKSTTKKRKLTTEERMRETKKIRERLEKDDEEEIKATPQPPKRGSKTKPPQKEDSEEEKEDSSQEVPKKKSKSSKSTEPPPKTLSWSTQTFLLTFPQWKGNETLQELLEKLHKFWKAKNKIVEEAVVTIEKHGASKKAAKGHQEGVDPGKHIHMCFKLNKKHHVKSVNFFDELGGKHGNIQTCRDYKACQIYCAKKDNLDNVITHNVDIDAVVESTKSKKGVKHETVARFVMETPRTMFELNENFPGYVLQNQRKCSGYLKLVKSFGKQVTPYLGIGNVIGKPPATIQVVSWLNNNLPPKERPFKQSQLWLWGPSNMGKTTLRMELSKHFKAYNVCDEEKWWSGFNTWHEIAFFEEFNGYKTLSQMKQFLDGSEVELGQKGEDPILKDKNIPVIILSNNPPDVVYKNAALENPNAFTPLLERLKVIHVTQFLDIPWIRPQEPTQSPIVIDLQEEETNLLLGTPEHREGSESPKIPLKRTKASKDLREQINVVQSSLTEELPTQVDPQQINLNCSEDLELNDNASSMSDDDVPQDQVDVDPYTQIENGDPYEQDDSQVDSESSETYKNWKRSKKLRRKDLLKK